MPAQTPAPRQDAATAQVTQAPPAQISAPPQGAGTTMVTTQAPPAQTSAPPQGAATAQVTQAPPAQISAPPQGAGTTMVTTQAPPAQTSAAPEPQPHGQSEPTDADMDSDDDDTDPNNLSQNEKLAIIRAITDAPENPDLFKQAFYNALPFPMDFKTVQALIHPDKYQDKEEKNQAQVAFQKLLTYREKAGKWMPGEADRHTNFYHGNDTNRPEEHVEGQLSANHKHAHQLATPHLKVLCSALAKNPRLNPYNLEEMDKDALAAASELNKINATITAENQAENKDSELGIIRYPDLFARWRPIFLQPELKVSQTTANRDWCQKFGYPTEWAAFDIPTPSINSQPQGGGDTPGNSLQLWNSTGGKTRTIAIVPRRTTRSVNPGYTSSGEKIRMIQNLGLYSARLVVEDTQGRVWLRSSAAAGGQPALNGAKMTGVPSTLQGDTEIAELRGKVRAGGQYGLDWVAVGEWDPTKKALPFIVVGFWHKGVHGPLQEAGLSRAALRKILAPREAERLIAESMISDPDLSLKEALYLICPDTKPAAHMALPGPHNPNHPWFPSMPQQLPPALNAPQGLPFQQPSALSQFQLPPQFQLPFSPKGQQAFLPQAQGVFPPQAHGVFPPQAQGVTPHAHGVFPPQAQGVTPHPQGVFPPQAQGVFPAYAQHPGLFTAAPPEEEL